jgi:hypothetical protein
VDCNGSFVINSITFWRTDSCDMGDCPVVHWEFSYGVQSGGNVSLSRRVYIVRAVC